MTAHDEADATYQRALAELERLTAVSTANPTDEDAAAASEAAYVTAQVAYVDLLAAIDASSAVSAVANSADPAVISAVPAAQPLGAVAAAPASHYDLSPLPGDPVAPAVPVEYVPSANPPTGADKYGPLSAAAHPAFGAPMAEAHFLVSL